LPDVEAAEVVEDRRRRLVLAAPFRRSSGRWCKPPGDDRQRAADERAARRGERANDGIEAMVIHA
jgi:hypothetical protein